MSQTPRQFLITFVQLSLLALTITTLGIEEGGGLPTVVALVVAGWVVHEAVPAAWRTQVFLALSVGVIVAKLGWDAPWVLIPALILSEISHLPIGLLPRSLLVVGAAVGLGVLRAGLVQTPWPVATLPFLASMFMFRIVLVLMDPGAANVSRWTRWAYFFQWPNVIFPLYPIVDWAAWRKKPSLSPYQLHQRGLRWIARGIVHLIAYRLVYHLALPPDFRVVSGPAAIAWILAGYVLYLRISGQFHLIVGFLLLFGRDLPETHHHFFLASSFNDYWRRVNIYWKDFVEKVLFYPLYLRLRRTGMPQPLVVSILATFLFTWVLHSWQWFWLRGEPLLSGIDAAFWAALGVLVAANSWWNSVSPSRGERGRGAYVVRSLKVVGMFTTLAVMWSFWRSETVGGWLSRIKILADGGTLVRVALVLAAAVAVGTVVQLLLDLPAVKRSVDGLAPERSTGLTLAMCAGLAALGVAESSALPGPQALLRPRAAIAREHLNEQDHLAKTRGYYEDLLPKASVIEEPWKATQGFPEGWIKLTDSQFVRRVSSPLVYELLPSMSGEFHRAPLSTNALGLRDREYPAVKPPGTFRVALLGASIEMGGGVPADGVFESLVEARLNREHGGRFEILNFSVDGWTLLQHITAYEAKVRPLDPDLVVIATHYGDGERVLRRIARLAHLGFDYPNELVRKLTVDHSLARIGSEDEAVQVLSQYEDQVMEELYRHLAREVARDGKKLLWLDVPQTREIISPPPPDGREEQAAAAGMVTLDLKGAYAGHEVSEVVQGTWDDHPNALGHWLIAERLYAKLVEVEARLGLGLDR